MSYETLQHLRIRLPKWLTSWSIFLLDLIPSFIAYKYFLIPDLIISVYNIILASGPKDVQALIKCGYKIDTIKQVNKLDLKKSITGKKENTDIYNKYNLNSESKINNGPLNKVTELL